jgi:3-hydroxyacyl-CoA dehydrogenase
LERIAVIGGKVGLDVVYDIEMIYYRDSNDPKDRPPDALLEMVRRGELGVKSGKGFYRYRDPQYLQPGFFNPSRPTTAVDCSTLKG